MDQIFKGLPFVFIYLDDRGLHLKHLHVVLDLLVQNGLILNQDKCSFAQPEIEYLGHKITPAWIIPLPFMLKHSSSNLVLKIYVDYRGFMAWLIFTEDFSLSNSGWKPKVPVLVSGTSELFRESQNHPFLRRFTDSSFPDNRCFRLTHWSSLAAAWEKQLKTPSLLLCKTLCHAATICFAFDRELLGVFLALHHFLFKLEGRRFHIITDHLPLVSALPLVSPPWSARQ